MLSTGDGCGRMSDVRSKESKAKLSARGLVHTLGLRCQLDGSGVPFCPT